MPGPERPAHRGWLGVVTGIRLIHIITASTAERHGDFLVLIITVVRSSLSKCCGLCPRSRFGEGNYTPNSSLWVTPLDLTRSLVPTFSTLPLSISISCSATAPRALDQPVCKVKTIFHYAILLASRSASWSQTCSRPQLANQLASWSQAG